MRKTNIHSLGRIAVALGVATTSGCVTNGKFIRTLAIAGLATLFAWLAATWIYGWLVENSDVAVARSITG